MLADALIRRARARGIPYKLFDGHGLYLLVTAIGSRYWRFKFRINSLEKVLALGVYPDVSLKLARERREQARRQVAQGIDPTATRKAEKSTPSNSFEAVGREWFAAYSPRWAPSHAGKVRRRLEMDIYPWIGKSQVSAVTARELLKCLRRIEARGALDTAHRSHQDCGRIFRYAIATGRAERDPSADLRGALPPAVEGHFPTITEPSKIGELLRAIDGYSGTIVVRCALRLAPFVFVRPGELRCALWADFDLRGAEWRIPGQRMKMKIPHIIPLSRQALDILRELHPLTGNGNYVFPSEQTKARSMSDNTVNAALRRLGYGVGEMTGHGFRSMASTLLNERGWDRDAVERQLAHTEKDNVRAAYNYAQYLPERRRMMQAWADYLDELRVHISAASYAEPRERAVKRFGQQTTDSFRPVWPPNPESRSQAIPPRERRS
jgi:integrase